MMMREESGRRCAISTTMNNSKKKTKQQNGNANLFETIRTKIRYVMGFRCIFNTLPDDNHNLEKLGAMKRNRQHQPNANQKKGNSNNKTQ